MFKQMMLRMHIVRIMFVSDRMRFVENGAITIIMIRVKMAMMSICQKNDLTIELIRITMVVIEINLIIA